ncbi:MAG: 50S ribosomal protein L29 [bacterium]
MEKEKIKTLSRKDLNEQLGFYMKKASNLVFDLNTNQSTIKFSEIDKEKKTVARILTKINYRNKGEANSEQK